MVALCLQQRRETPYIFMVGSGKPLTEIKMAFRAEIYLARILPRAKLLLFRLAV